MSLPHEQYASGEYYRKNPEWDIADSRWKAAQVMRMLVAHHISPTTAVEVGCGAGAVLCALQTFLPRCKFAGFDIAPDASRFWERADCANISFSVKDFLSTTTEQFGLLLCLDVIEHVADPFTFLTQLRSRADTFVFHFPLDLCAMSVLREQPLLEARRQVGHIHYFTQGLALSLLRECGYSIVDHFYTQAYLSFPPRNWKSTIARWPRKLIATINKGLAARLLGGDTLMVLAAPSRS